VAELLPARLVALQTQQALSAALPSLLRLLGVKDGTERKAFLSVGQGGTGGFSK